MAYGDEELRQTAVQPERTTLEEGAPAPLEGEQPLSGGGRGGRQPKNYRQRPTVEIGPAEAAKFGVEPGTYVRDGTNAFPLSAVEAAGGDFNQVDPSLGIVEQSGGRLNWGAVRNRQFATQQYGGPGGKMRNVREGLHQTYGQDEGNRVFQERLRMSREAEAQGASPEIAEFLFYQAGVLLPGGVVASYGPKGIIFEDLQGRPVQGTPAMEQQALAEHQRIFGAQQYPGAGGPAQTPSLPAPPGQAPQAQQGPLYSNRPAPPAPSPVMTKPKPPGGAIEPPQGLPAPPSMEQQSTIRPPDYSKAFSPAGGGSALTSTLPGMGGANKKPLGGLLDMKI